MAEIWYHCKKCMKTICIDSFPELSGCPSKTLHYWTALGEIGTVDYKCKHCRITVKTRNQPIISGCSVNTFHEWEREWGEIN
jgi:hypothetical protein